MHVHHSQLQPVALKWILDKSFGKDIHNLIFSSIVFHDDVPFLNIISQKVMPNINVLCSFVLDCILSHVNCSGIVTYERKGVDVDSEILQLLLDLKKCGTIRSNKYIFNLNY